MDGFVRVPPSAILAAPSFVPAALMAQAAGARPWTGTRTADGQPDIQGTWRPLIGGGRSLEDPGCRAASKTKSPGARGRARRTRAASSIHRTGRCRTSRGRRRCASSRWTTRSAPPGPKTSTRRRDASCSAPFVSRPTRTSSCRFRASSLLNEAYHNLPCRFRSTAGRRCPTPSSSGAATRAAVGGQHAGGRIGEDSQTAEVELTANDGDFLSDTAHRRALHVYRCRSHMRPTTTATIDDPRVFTRPWKIAIPNVLAEAAANGRDVGVACHEGERSAGIMLQESNSGALIARVANPRSAAREATSCHSIDQ